MKTLERFGKELIVHEGMQKKKKIVICVCSLSHLIDDINTTKYVDCKCGKRVKLCKEKSETR